MRPLNYRKTHTGKEIRCCHLGLFCYHDAVSLNIVSCDKEFSMRDVHPPLGAHLIADLHDAGALIDPVPAKDVLARAARAAGATLLDVAVHDFGDRAGFTGVATLAESHISIHTWPEYGYAAVDIFMCGDAQPELSLKVLQEYFKPARTEVQTIGRGHVSAPPVAAGF